MNILFAGPAVSPANKALALELAIIAAERQNRFAAMERSQAMISSVVDDDLGMRVLEEFQPIEVPNPDNPSNSSF